VTRAEHAKRKRRESNRKRLRKLVDQIHERDDRRCVYCGRGGSNYSLDFAPGAVPLSVKITIDHLTPRSRGGNDHPRNLVTACLSCNSKRKHLPLARWCEKIGLSWRKIYAQARRPLETKPDVEMRRGSKGREDDVEVGEFREEPVSDAHHC
jgi:hypothetical protein